MTDSHCHLYFDTYDGKREELIRVAQKAGVHTIVNIGIDVESSRRCVKLAEQHTGLFATVGVHPHDAKTADNSTFDQLRELAAHDRVVAIGEIGLDFYRDLSPRDVQKKVFRQLLELAIDLKMPVVIHTRDSFRETKDIIREYASSLAGGVFHCFPGSTAEAKEVIDLGFVISVGGIITFKNASMAKTAAETPLDKIMLETDAPFLAPMPYRGKTNQPAYVRFVRDKLAELKGISAAEVEKVTDRTAAKLYGLVETFGD